jgi:hypothetical protein
MASFSACGQRSLDIIGGSASHRASETRFPAEVTDRIINMLEKGVAPGEMLITRGDANTQRFIEAIECGSRPTSAAMPIFHFLLTGKDSTVPHAPLDSSHSWPFHRFPREWQNGTASHGR